MESSLMVSPAAPPKVQWMDKNFLKEAGKWSKKIDFQLQREKDAASKVLKLLLLGAGESGKSTLFKQFRTLYGKDFTEDERRQFTEVVRDNTLSSMVSLVKFSDVLTSENIQDFPPMLEQSRPSAKAILQAGESGRSLNSQLGIHIEQLWADPAIKTAYDLRARVHVIDSCKFFFDDIKLVASDNYVPTRDDVLRARARTTGIVETFVTVQNSTFHMIDVGGQRNERRKWIHCFENVTAVIFVAAISEYDQTLFEDHMVNRVEEALELFGEVCNSAWFRKTSMILFLNKSDLFKEKLKKVPLSLFFPKFKGGDNYDKACRFMEHRFVHQNKSHGQVYCHVTCATDTNMVSHVFDSVRDIIINNAIDSLGI